MSAMRAAEIKIAVIPAQAGIHFDLDL